MFKYPFSRLITRWIYWCLPPLLALFCWFIGALLPDEQVYSVMIQAVLLSSPPFWMLIWPVWAFILAIRWRAWFIWAWFLTPWWFGFPDACRDHGGDFILMTANVNAYTDAVAEIESALSREEADVLIVLEKRLCRLKG